MKQPTDDQKRYRSMGGHTTQPFRDNLERCRHDGQEVEMPGTGPPSTIIRQGDKYPEHRGSVVDETDR